MTLTVLHIKKLRDLFATGDDKRTEGLCRELIDVGRCCHDSSFNAVDLLQEWIERTKS